MSNNKAKYFLIGIITIGAIICSLAVYYLPIAKFDFGLLFLSAITIFFSSRLSIHFPNSKVHFMMGDALIFLTFLLYGGETAIVLAGAEAFWTSLRLKKQGVFTKFSTVLQNTGIMACSTAGTYAVVLLYSYFLNRPIDYNNPAEFFSLLGLMALVQFSANNFITALGGALKTGNSFLKTFIDKCLGSSVLYIVGAAVAGLAFKLIENISGFAVLIAAFVIGLLYLTYRHYIAEIKLRQEQAERSERERMEAESRRLQDAERHLEEMRQSQKMEAIGTLAGGVAHDFNNLLTVILGNTELAVGKLQPGDPVRVRLEEVEKAANRAAALTRQLLAFSRRQKMERRIINLNHSIGEIVKLLNRIIGADIEVKVKGDPNLLSVFADAAQVEQVIMNLAVNARDAMPQGGRLTIETNNIAVDEKNQSQYPYAQAGRYVQIIVSDTGSGIDEETQKRIFEPFFTTKEVGKGTGLGLSMAYGIVKQHDGYINVESEIGRGATFRIFLPVAENKVENQTPAMQFPFRGGSETILVAEDEESLRNLAKDILEGFGYTVLLAKNGEEAVEMYAANRERIDMLLLDVMMPRMGGAEVYERIRCLDQDIPLIFMTGYNSEIVQSRFAKQKRVIEESGAAVIQKPYSPKQLESKIREALAVREKKCLPVEIIG
ncbi:MAG: ATP-binding protein [Acidobacteriota bacterium]|nr:ATP-binding protein [Acidobacteriota bacterium]